jgi:hypothetical protein
MSFLYKNTLMLLFISTVISLFVAELILRLIGFQPWKADAYSKGPAIHEYDSVIGWRLKEGSFRLPPYNPDGPEVLYTFLKNGMRISYENQTDIYDNRPKLILVGGSYTQGWAISDDETFAWKLQEQFPEVEVLNYGVGGYGTYQSLLRLEEVLSYVKNPKVVIYSFVGHHELRNVASTSWMYELSRYSKKDIYLPFIRIDNNGVSYHRQIAHYNAWPFREISSLVSLFEEAYINIVAQWGEKDKRQITKKLLLKMRNLCVKYGTDFAVVILHGSETTKKYYMKFLKNNDIRGVDCEYPLTSDMRVEGEGHPNEMQHSQWASCIANALAKQILTDS